MNYKQIYEILTSLFYALNKKGEIMGKDMQVRIKELEAELARMKEEALEKDAQIEELTQDNEALYDGIAIAQAVLKKTKRLEKDLATQEQVTAEQAKLIEQLQAKNTNLVKESKDQKKELNHLVTALDHEKSRGYDLEEQTVRLNQELLELKKSKDAQISKLYSSSGIYKKVDEQVEAIQREYEEKLKSETSKIENSYKSQERKADIEYQDLIKVQAREIESLKETNQANKVKLLSFNAVTRNLAEAREIVSQQEETILSLQQIIESLNARKPLEIKIVPQEEMVTSDRVVTTEKIENSQIALSDIHKELDKLSKILTRREKRVVINTVKEEKAIEPVSEKGKKVVEPALVESPVPKKNAKDVLANIKNVLAKTSVSTSADQAQASTDKRIQR